MKTNKNIYYAIGIVINLLYLSLTACTDSFGEWKSVEKKNGALTLALELPRSKTVELATRAMQEVQERDIQEITLLLFTNVPGNTEQLHSTVAIPRTALVQNPSDTRLYTTTATLEPGTYSTIIALANSAGALSAQSSLMVKGTPRDQIEKELLLSLPDNTRWEAAQPNPRQFPMWGQIEGGSTGIVINSNTPANHHIKLFRMLASIDIVIEQEDDQGQPLPAFDLTKVYLCHFYRNGRMIPLNNTTHYDGNKLLDISLPDPTDRLLYTDPLEYSGTLADATSAPDIIIRREIYTFEQPQSDGEEESQKPFLIIEGEYEDTGYPSFYRIDFVERLYEDPADPLPAENNFLPLIRNYTYNIVVKEILGPGYRSFDDAATCKPFNTVSNIFRFDDSDSEAVQFDGKYFLSVSHDSISFNKEQATEPLVIKTDSPLGWKIGDITYSGGDGSTGWLYMDKTTGTRDVPGHVNVTADAYNPTTPNPTPREATFTVSCGRMEHTIQVTQSYLTGISLEIVNSAGEPITEIWFRSNPRENDLPPDETFTVKWSGPDGCNLEVIMLGDRMFSFDTSGANAIFEGRKLGPGEENHTFTIRPTAFTLKDTDPEEGNPFLQDGATVTFSVSNGQETIKKNIYIRHQCISIVFRELDGFTYMGDTDAFKVYSNTSWRLKGVNTEINGMFLTPQGADFGTMVGTSGIYNVTEGVELTYRVNHDAATSGIYAIGKAGRKMYLTFEDTEGIISDQTISIIAATPDANCYMVPAGGTLQIPLRKLFWIWEKELQEELDPKAAGILNHTPQIIWQTDNGLIQTATVNGNSGDYRDYTLDITTSAAFPEGNAVVAILSNDGRIRWSYHIWVTPYNPDNGGPVFPLSANHLFMDRNIGSNGDHTTLNPEGAGMYYQWGRKDPFPGSSYYDDTWEIPLDQNPTLNQRRVVDAFNQQVLINFDNVATLRNLENSIHHPTVFYKADEWEVSVMQDWYTHSDSEMKYQNNYLWNDKKTEKPHTIPVRKGGECRQRQI